MAVLKADRYVKVSSMKEVKKCQNVVRQEKLKMDLIEGNRDFFAKIVHLILYGYKQLIS